MANLLVLLEFYRGAPHPVALEALGQARRLGSSLGLTVYALAPLQKGPATLIEVEPGSLSGPAGADSVEEDITTTCGRYGADKVVLLTGDQLVAESEMRFQAYAGALLAACTQLPPRLLLMADTPAGRDVAPRLAARLGAAYLPRGAALVEDEQLVLCDERGRHLRIPAESVTTEGLPPLAIPVVVTIPPGRHELAEGVQDAEMLLVAAADVGSDSTPTAMPGFVEEQIEPLPIDERIDRGLARTAVPLCVLSAGPDTNSAADERRELTPPWRVAVGPRAEDDTQARYALNVPASERDAALQALCSGLAQAVAPSSLRSKPGRGGRAKQKSGFGDLSQITPTAELEAWDEGEAAITGDTDSTTKMQAVAATEEIPIVPRREVTSLQETPTPPPALGGGPVAFGEDVGMWEGWATPPRGAPSAPARDDAAPQFELENADTAPVPIATPASKADAEKPVGKPVAFSRPLRIEAPVGSPKGLKPKEKP